MAIERDLLDLRDQLAKVASERDEYRKLVHLLREEVERLKRGLLGQKAERVPKNDAQLSLAILELLEAGKPVVEPDAEPATETITYKRRKPVRRKFPENLPVVELEIVPEDVRKSGLDNFVRIGQDESKSVERRPASIVVVHTIRPKFVAKDRDKNADTKVLIAEPPELPIPKSNVGPGFLADSIVKRWQDHLPLNRMESIYAREGLEFNRSTICGWHQQLLPLVKPLVKAMREDALQQPYLCSDSTGVLVQAPEKCRVGHFWVYVAPERHVFFEYSAKHDSAAVDSVLAGYKGYLVADATSVLDHLYTAGDLVEVGCWAHARRYFYKAMSSHPELAREALAMIGAIFKVERDLVSAPRKKRGEARSQISRPIVEKFFAWCIEQQPRCLDETPIAKAIGYAMNQRAALERFLMEPMLPIHNNSSELQLRRLAVGRKNWLFVGSDESAEVVTAFVTLLASCQMHKIEPWAYLRDILCLLPRWKQNRVFELAPVNWNETLQQQETQERLDANVYRRVTLE